MARAVMYWLPTLSLGESTSLMAFQTGLATVASLHSKTLLVPSSRRFAFEGSMAKDFCTE